MGDLSPHFSRHEFRCKGCSKANPCPWFPTDAVDAALIAVLEKVRTHFGKPVTVNSGSRCTPHNTSVGGSPKSQHVKSKAADIVVSGVTPKTVYDFLDPAHSGGLGLYDTFVHVDVRDGKARWQLPQPSQPIAGSV